MMLLWSYPEEITTLQSNADTNQSNTDNFYNVLGIKTEIIYLIVYYSHHISRCTNTV